MGGQTTQAAQRSDTLQIKLPVEHRDQRFPTFNERKSLNAARTAQPSPQNAFNMRPSEVARPKMQKDSPSPQLAQHDI